MATVLYVNPDQSKIAFGNALGCGYRSDVPAQFAGIAVAPCVILAGGGLAPVVLGDDGTLTAAKVAAALAPILTAENAAQAVVAQQGANQSTIQQLAVVALPANRTDQTQDATVQSGAATINGTAGPFTLAQCTTFIKQLAQAVSTLAANDVNAKKELNLLIRLALQQFDATN